MATTVKLNLRMSNNIVGTIQADNNSYYDPITGVNLNRGNLTSGDISGFSNSQLVNIANAVYNGTLTLVTGSLPGPTDSYKSYSLFASAAYYATGGSTFGPGWYGVTSVAAADALQDNWGSPNPGAPENPAPNPLIPPATPN